MTMRGASAVDGGGTSGQAPGGNSDAPNVQGDFEELMHHRPVFRVRLHGYDRLEVDNYTAWAEDELIAVRREVDHLLSRYGECSAQLEISRRLLADAPPGREAFPISQRVKEMLRLAEDEAAALTDAGRREAERVVAEARTEADARLRKAHEIKQMAVEAADELLEQARRDRATAAAQLEHAETEAAETLRQAAIERDRLAARAAQERERADAAAAAHLALVQAEVDGLRRQHDLARQSVRVLTDRLDEALRAVADTVSEDAPRTHVLRGNVAVDGSSPGQREDHDEADVAVMVGRPAPVPH